jgi:hypothetical protein
MVQPKKIVDTRFFATVIVSRLALIEVALFTPRQRTTTEDVTEICILLYEPINGSVVRLLALAATVELVSPSQSIYSKHINHEREEHSPYFISLTFLRFKREESD